MVIKGTFANDSPMIAIPNYARNNRGSGEPGSDAAGAGPASGGRGRRGRAPSSIVWMRDQ
jgi:hypothetical protein